MTCTRPKKKDKPTPKVINASELRVGQKCRPQGWKGKPVYKVTKIVKVGGPTGRVVDKVYLSRVSCMGCPNPPPEKHIVGATDRVTLIE